MGQSDVTPERLKVLALTLPHLPICEWSDDKAWGAAQVLVPVPELGVADVCKAVLLHIVPPGNDQPLPQNLPHLCLSWDCQLKDCEESILWPIILLTFKRNQNLCRSNIQELTTSREWTSIVQIVITWRATMQRSIYQLSSNLLTISSRQISQEQRDEVVELDDLLLIIILQ